MVFRNTSRAGCSQGRSPSVVSLPWQFRCWLWARALRGCGAAAAQSESFCPKCQTLRNKDPNSWRHLQLHPLAAGSLAADPATGLWVQVTSAAWADQAGAGGREKNAGCGWRANAPPRAESEAPAERRRGCARLAPGAERRASPLNSTNKIVPTNHQSFLRIRNSADCGPFC